MDNTASQVVDLLISHSQLSIRSRSYDEQSSQWGKVNLTQGAVLYDDYVTFDPLPDDAFGANVVLTVSESFTLDKAAKRCIVVPFSITDNNNVTVSSVNEKFRIQLAFNDVLYS